MPGKTYIKQFKKDCRDGARAALEDKIDRLKNPQKYVDDNGDEVED